MNTGDLLSYKVYQHTVFDVLGNKWLEQQHDGAIFSLNGKLAFSTDSYVGTPIFFPGGNIGDLAINGTVNNLAMCGAVAKYLSLSFIIENGFSVPAFQKILYSIKEAAEAAGVFIVTGDTKVVNKGKGDQLYINTSGIGYVHSRADIGHHLIGEGDAVIISGNIGTHGMAIKSAAGDVPLAAIESDTRPLHEMVFHMLDVAGNNVRFLRDPTRGGLATALLDLATITGLGLSVNEAILPVDEQVAFVCSGLGIDPLYLANKGVLLAVVKKESAAACVALLRNCAGGEKACIIGEVTDLHPGTVVLRNSSGGHRVIDMLTGEALLAADQFPDQEE